MNQGTKDVINGVLAMINPALGIISTFVTNDKVLAVTRDVQDAVNVATSLMPIVKQFGSGQEVTPDDVRAALAGKDKALAEFDALIAERGG